MSLQVFALPARFRKQNINNFCKEDIIRIFQYLDGSEIARTVFPVCKKWIEIGRDPVLWKKLIVNLANSGLNIKMERQIVQVVQNATLLEDFVFASHDDVSRILLSVGQSCPRLKRISLFSCSAEIVFCVQALVFGCPLIEEITIFGTSGSALNQLAELKQIRCLVSTDNDWFDDTFLSRLSTNSKLESLLFAEKHNRDQSLVPLFANLKSVLKKVHVDCSHCTSRTYEMILQCRELRDLEITEAVQLEDRHLKKMEALPLLEHFTINNAKKVSSEALCSFIKNVKSTKIETVNFAECPTVDRSLEQFLRSHVDTILYKVKRLDLSSCINVTDHLLDMILKGNPVLERLRLSSIASLRGTAFNTTDTRIAPLLKDLIVTNCLRMVITYLHTFRKNRPSLKIMFPTDLEFPEIPFLEELAFERGF